MRTENQTADKRFEEIKNAMPQKNERFAALTPNTIIEINQWRNILKDHFPELTFPAEVGLSVIAQLLIRDIKNPCALVYVDVPSSGKTIVLNFFSTIKELTYITDNFTNASFVSHSANTKKEDLARNDMLPQIQYKTMIIRDMAPIFAKRDEDVEAMLGVLIRVLDGEGLETNSGLYGKRGYTGDYLFMLLSASTPIRPKIWKAMGNLGSRLFFLNINGREKSEAELANQVKTVCRDKEVICREVTSEFLKTLWAKYPQGVNWINKEDDAKLLETIARLSKILARLRSSINVWEERFGQKGYNYTQPITEMPDRLNQLLYNLARGHAVACGRTQLDQEDLKIVLRVALDSAPPNRARIFKRLIIEGGTIKTNRAMEILKCSRPTALKHMQELNLLDLVDTHGNMEDDTEVLMGRPEQEITLKDKYGWFLGEECQSLLVEEDIKGLLSESDTVPEEQEALI